MSRYTTISRAGRIDAAAAEVLSLVSSTEGFTAINPHRTADPKLELTPFGPSNGVGSGFAFSGKGGKGTQVVSEVTDHHVEYAIDMGSMGQSTQRIVATPASHDGCDVEWSMTFDAGRNPMLRIFGLVANRVLGPTLDSGIRNLASTTWR